MLVTGIALLIGAALLASAAVVAARRWARRRALAELRPRAVAAQEGEHVSLHGVIRPGPGGPVESRLARVECVWHAHEVLRHYRRLTPGRGPDSGEGERACDSIADYGSADLFALAGPTAPAAPAHDPDRLVLVDPADAEFVKVDMCLQRVVGRPQRGVAASADDLLSRVKGRISGVFRGETIEFEYREWVVRAGEPVVVHGRVALREGRPVLVAPAEGRLRVEVGTAEEPAAVPRATAARLLGAAAFAAACGGAVLLVVAG